MGITQSLLAEEHETELPEYDLLESCELSYYGVFHLVLHKPSDTKFFYREFMMDKSSSNLTPELFFLRITNPIPSLLELKTGNLIENDENFEGFILIKAFDLDSTLANSIAVKSQGMRYFSEEEIWKMLESCINGLEYMASTGKSALCVSPFHIYIQDDLYKILDFEDITDLMNNLDLSESPMIYYQSPHLINALKGQEPIDINEKDNIFSLGISVIEAGLLEHPLSNQQGELNLSFDCLEEVFSNLKTRYSPHLIDFLRNMVALEENDRFDLEKLNLELTRRTEKFAETPKSFKHKDELFGLGKSKINTGISIPFSNDFRFSGQSPLNKEAPKNLVLGRPQDKTINEESEYIQNNFEKKSKDKLTAQEIQEIYYLSSEVLPKSELFKSVESNVNRNSNNQPVPTFADYRVSIQTKVEENPNRPSNETASNRPSHFKKDEENVKKGGFSGDVNMMSPFTSEIIEKALVNKGKPLDVNKYTQIQSEDYETIEFKSPEKVVERKSEDQEKVIKKESLYQSNYEQKVSINNNNNNNFYESIAKNEDAYKNNNYNSAAQQLTVEYGQQDRLKYSENANELKNEPFLKTITENSSQMQHTSEFPYYRTIENKSVFNNYDQTTPKTYDYIDKAPLTQSLNYTAEKSNDYKMSQSSYQVYSPANNLPAYSVYNAIEVQNKLTDVLKPNSYTGYTGNIYGNPSEPIQMTQNSYSQNQYEPNYQVSYTTHYQQYPHYLSEETKQLDVYQAISDKPKIITQNYDELVKKSIHNSIIDGNNSAYFDRPVSGNEYLDTVLNKNQFEESKYIEKTPKKIFFEGRNFAVSEQKTSFDRNGDIRFARSAEGSALKIREIEQEFQRKSMMIQESKKAVDKSLNVLRDACYFLKQKRTLLV